MKKIIFVIFLTLISTASFIGCNNKQVALERDLKTGSISSKADADLSVADNNAPSIDEGPNINSAPVELNNLNEVTRTYVWPLIATGPICTYTWQYPSDIKSNDLVNVCAYNNLLNLPLNPSDGTIFGGAEFVNWKAPANQVEAAIQKHFDVSSEYLKTSELYSSEADTYEMISGWGGGWGVTALSAEQNGSQIIIEIGTSSDQSEPIPTGTLVIELDAQNIVKYKSYTLTA